MNKLLSFVGDTEISNNFSCLESSSTCQKNNQFALKEGKKQDKDKCRKRIANKQTRNAKKITSTRNYRKKSPICKNGADKEMLNDYLWRL